MKRVNNMNVIRKIISLYRKHFYSLEKQAKIAGVNMGKHNFIASRFWSSEPYLITIGDYCGITAGVKLFTHGGGHAIRHKYPDFDLFGKVSIGNYVYLGNNVLVMPGVTIGDNVLVAAGSVVTKSIPSGCVVAGNPAKFICTIEEYANRNLKYNTKTKGLDSKLKKEFLMNVDNDYFIRKSQLTVD